MSWRVGDVEALLAEVSRAVIMPKFGNLAASEVRAKSAPNDLVTEVDEAAERRLKAGLRAIDPAARFIGEEEAAKDPARVAAIEGEGAHWVVDPIDGTRNFVRGAPEFATIVARVENGETVAGWIYAHPEEACATAVRGGGVLWRGEALRAVPPAGRPRGLRSVGWLSDAWRDRIVSNMKAGAETAANHCSAYAYLNLLRGVADFKVSSRIHPWDHAAGAMMLAEMGGAVRWLDDAARYLPSDSADRPLLAAAPGRDWPQLAAMLLDGDAA